MKTGIIAALLIALSWGLLPAQADVGKDDFNLVVKSSPPAKVDPNEAIYLRARVNELEAEVKLLKASQHKTFGLAYVDSEGNLKLKAEDNGGDWSWDGKSFFRPSTSFVQPATTFTFPATNNCPNGRCPTTR